MNKRKYSIFISSTYEDLKDDLSALKDPEGLAENVLEYLKIN